ncbi:hypothetical protein [Microbacterium sp. No. 7]|uniref:hypothetical protein n=1 Tax=Microbacterium sp. No. 7 TaxID=1714373 RepID=UPI0006D1D6E3|nr:hypothetical protein [Microbacterium sp. No. 7]ALJ19059.1 hypothetical protein AOA12_03715 [Microbacterium sp. No. 7]
MNDPQIWTLIAVFGTIMIGGLTLSTTLINRSTQAQVNGLRGELDAQIGGLRGELDAQIGGLRGELSARFDAVHSRLDTIDAKITHLDRDVTWLMNRAWGEPSSDR